MSYTRNFGFRSFENIVRDGRNKVPASATSGYLIGTAAVVASDSTLGRPSASAAPTALSGLVVYEHIQYQGVDPFLASPQDAPFQVAPAGRYAQLVRGNGVKVFLKNTDDKPLYDGRIEAGVTVVDATDLATLAVGDYLDPKADGTWKKAADATTAWLQVESVNATTKVVEARLTF